MPKRAPAKLRQVNARVTVEEWKELHVLAASEERNPSDMVRLLIRRAYDAHKRMNEATRNA
jgi:hypothetical protein